MGKRKSTQSKQPPKFVLKHDPNYRIIYANGAFSGVNPSEAYITIFSDLPVPEIATPQGKMQTKHILRQLHITIKFPLPQFLAFAKMIEHQKQDLIQKGVVNAKKADAVEPTPQTYIG